MLTFIAHLGSAVCWTHTKTVGINVSRVDTGPTLRGRHALMAQYMSKRSIAVIVPKQSVRQLIWKARRDSR